MKNKRSNDHEQGKIMKINYRNNLENTCTEIRFVNVIECLKLATSF